MAKCGSCGKFLSSNNCVHCGKCKGAYHKECANVSDKTGSKAWICSVCKSGTACTSNPISPTNEYELNSDFATPKAVIGDNLQEKKIDLATEIRSFRNELSSIRAEIREYRNEISVFKVELKSHGESIAKIENRLLFLEEKVEARIPTDLDPLENTIRELKCQLNERDQELFLNDVEITGIPETKNESLCHLVKVLATTLGTKIEEQDIVYVERIGSTRRNRIQSADGADIPSTAAGTAAQRSRHIVARFMRRSMRDDVLRAARIRRGVTTSDLQLPGSASRVYVNERLTRTNRQLFYQARQAAADHKWKYVWTREGKILVRKEDGQKVKVVRSENDINVIFG